MCMRIQSYWKNKITNNDRKQIKKFVVQLNEMEHENVNK